MDILSKKKQKILAPAPEASVSMFQTPSMALMPSSEIYSRRINISKTVKKPCSECNGTGEHVVAKENFKGFGEVDIYADCMVCNGTGFFEEKIIIRKKIHGPEIREDNCGTKREAERMGLAS